MPIFYFHVSNGQTTFPDADGLDYFDFASPRSYAARLANDLRDRSSFFGFYVAVHDEMDRRLTRVSVSDISRGVTRVRR